MVNGNRRTGRMRRDLIVIFIVTVGAFVCAAFFDLFEILQDWVKQTERWFPQFDEIFVVFMVLTFAFALLSARRWRELTVEVAERERAEQKLLEIRGNLEAEVTARTTELQATNDLLKARIVEQAQVEEQLRESEKRYRQIVNDAGDIIYRTDAQGVFTFVNPTVQKVLKYDSAEIIGKHFSTLIRPDHRQQALRFYAKQFLQKIPSTYYEFPVYANDGAEVWMGQSVQLILEGAQVIGFHAIARDITERLLAQEATRRAEEYRDLFRLANDPILIIDPDGEIVIDVNEKACQTYGIARQSFIGLSMRDLSQDPIGGERHLKAVLASQGNWEFETVQIRADGMPLHLLIHSAIIEYQGRKAILSINRDITERKVAEEALRQSEERLFHSQRMEAVGRLAGGIAHDFNNLLTAIGGYSGLTLMHLAANDPLRPYIEEIKKAGNRAASLTRQLLAFSRKQVLKPKVINLNTLIQDICKMLPRLIGEDIDLHTEFATDLWNVKADPAQIEQVLINLAVNARDALPDGGKLILQTVNVFLDEGEQREPLEALPGAYVMLAVIDTGTGISEETKTKIFEPFFTTKEPGKGTGLGLATVYGIVKQSGGHILVCSQVGQGTTFKIYLPRVSEEVELVVPDKLIRKDIKGGETILLVEDEDIVREITFRTLAIEGYQVLKARNGDEALLICEQYKENIHLLLTDVVMPGISGQVLADQISTARPAIGILFMSGYTDDAIVHKGVLMEGTNFLGKPFAPEQLARKVREVLDQTRDAYK
jgi:two-component system, cell cycle sensor histidine kinase and response regulator CckA